MVALAHDKFDEVFGTARGHNGSVRVVGDLRVNIIDASEVANEYRCLDVEGRSSVLADQVAALAICPHELVQADVQVKHADHEHVVLTLDAKVADPAAVEAAAVEARADTWADDWSPQDTAEAVFELVIASSPRPSPDELGIEYDCDAEALRVVRD